MPLPDPQAVALSIMADRAVCTVCDCLAPLGVEVAVLKGVLWQHTLYDRPGERRFSDVDLLVRERDFSRAVGALSTIGFVPLDNPQGGHERPLSHPDLPFLLDLHNRLFARFRYDLPTEAVFARGTRNSGLFGRQVVVPAPLDQLANLIGHFTSNHAPATPTEVSDLGRLVLRHRLHSQDVAAHLSRHGLGRAARFALPELTSSQVASFSLDTLTALGPDPLGERLAAAARQRLAQRKNRQDLRLAGLAHCLNGSLPRAACSALEAALRLAQQRLRGEASPTIG